MLIECFSFSTCLGISLVCVCVCFGVTYRDEDLEAAVEDFDVLVLQQAAHDGYIGLCIRTALSAGGDLSSDTSRPVLAPPGVVCRDVKGQEVAVLKGKSHQPQYNR